MIKRTRETERETQRETERERQRETHKERHRERKRDRETEKGDVTPALRGIIKVRGYKSELETTLPRIHGIETQPVFMYYI